MSYKVFLLPVFEKQLRRLVKKYPSLKKEFAALITLLEHNPRYGSLLGKNCYKIRLSISSKGKGKSGGARVITAVLVSETSVYLLAIYDKSEKENISDAELRQLLKDI